jgi:mRNA-degrading endonuclease YafQ of YafQ-DinJ toxin-antitoxin module
MIAIQYAPSFIKMYKGLDRNLKEEVKEKISLFQNSDNHIKLKVHKLQGRMLEKYAFSVNYKVRIVFRFEHKELASLLYVGSHDEVY